MDPRVVAKNAPTPPATAPMLMPPGTPDQEKIEEAIRQWRDLGCTPGNGNQEFFRLGLRLAYAGVPDHEIEHTLAEQSQYAHTPKDRRRNIPYVMRGLRRRRAQTRAPTT